MKIYIIRHGQTLWNKEKRMQGSGDSPLTEKGIEEAKKLGEAIKELKIDLIYTSPLGRTLETTDYIKGDRDIPIAIIDEIQEMCFGEIEGKELKVVEENYEEMIYNLWNDPINYINPSGESFDDVYERVEVGFNKILENKDYENVLVITHGVVITVLFSILNGGSVENTWDMGIVDNTSVSILEVDEDGDIQILSKNDTWHLN